MSKDRDTPLESKALSIVYGTNFVDLSYYNFIAWKPEIAKLWAECVMSMAYNLLALNSSPFTSLRKAHTRLIISRNKSDIPVKHIVRFFARHSDDRRRVEGALEAAGLPSGKNMHITEKQFTFSKFVDFYTKLTNRVEVDTVFSQLIGQSGKKSGGCMTLDQLVMFLNDYQRDPRLNEILYPYADHNKAKEVVQQFEPNKDNIAKNLLSGEGFLHYLLSDENIIIARDKLDLCHDMDKPLSHYFINSSHNTYLIGHQLTGRSSVEMYRQCLLAGCRCVELDFWNGRIDEPVVVHGYTLVPEISAKEVLEAIAESAFKTSDWPVILSFENHCNPRQQAKIAQYCREFFGDMLLDTCLDSNELTPGVSLPHPCQLKRKILIKNKKKHRTHKKKDGAGNVGAGIGVAIGVGFGVGETQFHVELKEVVDQSSSGAAATGDNSSGGAVVARSPGGVHGNGEIPRPNLEKEPSHESSDVDPEEANGQIPEGGPADESSSSDEEDDGHEERGNQSKDTSSEEVEAGAEISELVNYVQPVHFHSFELSERRNRSYEMSSFVETHTLNLLKENPVEFVNYNKRQLARVYPRGTRVDSSNFLPHQFWNAGCQLVALNYQTIDLSMQLNLGLFEFNSRSGYLLKPDFMIRPDRRFDPFAESTVDGIIAGTVSVQVLSGQFLCDKRTGCYVEVEMYGLPADTVRKRFKTKTVSNNCINPVWDEDPFVFKKVVLPELATVRIAAYEDTGSRPLLGHRVLPVVGLRPGYRHIVLRNESGQPLGLSTLFVYIKVRDYVPDGLSDFAEALVNPIKYQSELEKRAQQLSVFQDDDDTADGEEDGELPNTPVVSSFKEGAERTKSGAADKEQKDSNGDVLATLASVGGTDTTTPKRQNSISQKNQLSTKVSEEKSILDIPVCALETFVVEVEDMEKLQSHKSIKEKRLKIEKELLEVRKKHKKERLGLASGVDKKKKELVKQHSKLEKKMSSTKSIDESSPPGRLSSEHQHRLQEVTQGYHTALQAMVRQQLDHERKLQDKQHEMLYLCIDKLLKASQAAQVKMLQALHDRGVEDLKKKQDEYLREERKVLTKNTSDKQELERKKREMRQALVVRGIQERQRLTDLYNKKKEELDTKHEEIKRKFEEERDKAHRLIDEEHDKRLNNMDDMSLKEETLSVK
uniref:1-phosphatidylinositol 4,5-bisphosphate phosphodiesterase n=4 Tax=Hirondellea gigas TaxID=1518452 RepID=A0A6A7FZA1_9CRUS